MPSQRHSSGDLSERPRGEPVVTVGQVELPAGILDATRAAVLAVGVRRTTLTDVARRAGVSRMTVYRLVPDVETLVLEVLTREFGALVAQAERSVARRRTARSRLVGSIVEVARLLPDQPLFTRIVDVDPELLLPYVTDRIGSTQQIALGHVRRLLIEGHADRSIRRGDPDTQAMTVMLTVMPFALSARLLDQAGRRDAALRELATLLDLGLAP